LFGKEAFLLNGSHSLGEKCGEKITFYYYYRFSSLHLGYVVARIIKDREWEEIFQIK